MTLRPFVISAILGIAASAMAAVPGSFRMQALVADGAAAQADKAVTVRVGIRAAKADAADIYTETHRLTTDAMGLVTFNVGEGKATKGAFSEIVWADGEYYIAMAIDRGEGFVDAGTQRIAAVPYAKVADAARALVMTSASGKQFTVTIDDEGRLVATPVVK